MGGRSGRQDILVPRVIGQSEQARDRKSGSLQRKPRKWNKEEFFKDCYDRIDKEVINNVYLPLYEFILKESDEPTWGSGIEKGTYSFKIKAKNKMVNIFNITTSGLIAFGLGNIDDEKAVEFIRNSMANEFSETLKNAPYPSFESVILKNTKGGVEKFKTMIRNVVLKLK